MLWAVETKASAQILWAREPLSSLSDAAGWLVWVLATVTVYTVHVSRKGHVEALERALTRAAAHGGTSHDGTGTTSAIAVEMN